MFCTNCGKEVNDNAYICPYCGKLLNDTQAPTQMQASSAQPTNGKKNQVLGILSTAFAGIVLILSLISRFVSIQGGMAYSFFHWLFSITAIVLGIVGIVMNKKRGFFEPWSVVGLSLGVVLIL